MITSELKLITQSRSAVYECDVDVRTECTRQSLPKYELILYQLLRHKPNTESECDDRQRKLAEVQKSPAEANDVGSSVGLSAIQNWRTC